MTNDGVKGRYRDNVSKSEMVSHDQDKTTLLRSTRQSNGPTSMFEYQESSAKIQQQSPEIRKLSQVGEYQTKVAKMYLGQACPLDCSIK
jgi:hypothetical protein